MGLSTTTPITGSLDGAFPDGIDPRKPINVTDATLTLGTKHHGVVTTLNLAAGQAVTLPASTGSGSHFRLYLGTTVTSDTTIKVANGDDVLVGQAVNAQDAANTVIAFETAAASDTITLNGSTTGGIKGDFIELIDVAANTWAVSVRGSATGIEATPFSATVA